MAPQQRYQTRYQTRSSQQRRQHHPQRPAQGGNDAPRPLDGRALLPLRAFLGFTFTYAGLQKLANPAYLNAHSPTSVQSTILSLQHSSPIGWMLGISSHAPVLVGIMIALGELFVGLATLLGLWVRLASLGGLLLALTFFLTVSWRTTPYYYGSDIVFVFAWTVPLILGQWTGWTLDGWIRRQAATDPDPQRRAMVLGTTSAGVLAALGGLTAMITAVVGRAAHHSSPAPAAAPNPTPVPDASANSGGSSTGTQGPGRHLTRASAVPPGHAASFTDPQGNPAWLVHETDGSFAAFSAICTHAGCTVDFTGQDFVCPCHGGAYSAKTGAVIAGPPPSPLPSLKVQVVNGDVRLV